MNIFRNNTVSGQAGQDIALHAAIVAASAIQPEDIAPATDTRDILTRNIDSIERALTAARQHAERLDAELRRVTEELRQTRLSIEAFELAHGKMVEGRQ